MFSPTGLPNRRQFLERSALGFGSAFLLPSLLTSCTDHRIPEPGMPLILGSEHPVTIKVGDEAIDWNDDAKSLVTAGLSMIPEVGEILSALVDILWPGTDVWSQIKERVEALIDQKIDAVVYNGIQDKLKGLNEVLKCYKKALGIKSPGVEYSQWKTTIYFFGEAYDTFKRDDKDPYKLLVLPLSAQFANLYLAFLRDLVIKGEEWGRSPDERQADISDLRKAISEFRDYTLATYNSGLTDVVNNTTADDVKCEPFASINRYGREMTLSVLDYWHTWEYYDVTKYPQGATVTLSRELYSDPYGSWGQGGNIVLPQKLQQLPTKGPNKIVIKAGYSIGTTVLYYDPGTGPYGKDAIIYGVDPEDYTDQSAYTEYTTTITPDNPIVGINVMYRLQPSYADYTNVDALQFQLKNGIIQSPIGRYNPALDFSMRWVGIPDHYMTSLYINGSIRTWGGDYLNPYHAAGCVVFSFRYIDGAPPVKTETVRRIYITSPRERSAAEFAQAFPHLGISQVMITDQVKAERQAHWASLKDFDCPGL